MVIITIIVMLMAARCLQVLPALSLLLPVIITMVTCWLGRTTRLPAPYRPMGRQPDR